ncbi:hypothetical protein CJ030_MR2G020032 [Morella rubra]|uniref:Uncharacterized protein n=1 Tax=Morella rubra TaxID=262757 RepID=A0A6A1WCS0_9ROSI|nr:hypothetical protein CJ030_MR2G020032 [Morella rubra]
MSQIYVVLLLLLDNDGACRFTDNTPTQDVGKMRFIGASGTPMACHASSYGPSNSALACLMALPAPKNAQLGNMLRHGLGNTYKELMQADSGGVKVHFASTTTWPPATVVPEEVHREIVSGGSHDEVEEIGSTTT